MERRRASSPSRRKYRLLLRIYAAEHLRHVSSQGTYCKATIDEGDAPTRNSARASLKRLLQGSARANANANNAFDTSDDPLAPLPQRMVKTLVQKSTQGKPMWNEKFELPVLDPTHEVIHFRIKTARLLSAPAIGGGSVQLSDVSSDETFDRWINLFDNSKRPAGRLRIQMRLTAVSAIASPTPPVARSVSSSSMASPYLRGRHTNSVGTEERDTYYQHPRRTTSSNSMPSPNRSPMPRSNRRGAIIAPPLGGVATFRRSSTLSRSLLEMRTSGSTTASDSISSDTSHNGSVAPYTLNGSFLHQTPEESYSPLVTKHAPPPTPVLTTTGTVRETHTGRSTTSSRYTGVSGHDRSTAISRTTAMSVSRDTEELDFLASKYMVKPTRATTTRTSSHPVPAPLSPARTHPPVVAKESSPHESSQSRATRELSLRELRTSHQIVPEEDPTDEAADIFEEQPVSASSSPSASPPPGPSLSEIKRHTSNPTNVSATAKTQSPKDDRSPRTTNTTARSSSDDNDSEELGETVEFDFDTGDVRPSTRLPSHMMRSTVTRSSIATSRIDSDDDNNVSEKDDDSEDDDDDSDDDDNEPEDDEMDPDGPSDGPRVALRNTVTQLLRRDSVNVIMDVDEEDDDDDEFELEPFVFDELPMLDIYGSFHFQIKDIDCTDQAAAAS